MSLFGSASAGAMIIAGILIAAPAIAQETSTTAPGRSGEPLQAAVQPTASGGAISGVVTNETGETNLEGALVRIEQLGRETSTDREGRFGFSEVPAGSYDVTVTYFGAEPL
jgi:hypothetical protein